MSRALILTASMGEGHNTAARNIRDALLAEGPHDVLVADPYTRTNPIVNRLMQKGYTAAINKYPTAWKVMFRVLSKPGVVEGMGPMLAELTAGVRSMINEFKPDIIASTYPVFSFLIAKIRKKAPETPPLYTVITDSTMINSSWFRCHCNGFVVADEATGQVLRDGGVPEHLINVIGFPVSLAFESLKECPPPDSNQPWRAIFFPGGASKRAIATLKRLGAIPNLQVTVVTGRRQAVNMALKKAGLPSSGELLGWTEEMPRLMSEHHIFIGKAGGATVQEAIASRLPFIVNHIVPGQEEGNIALIERHGIGTLGTGNPERVGDIVEGALANNACIWKAWRQNFDQLTTAQASRDIARFLLERVPGGSK